MIDVNALGRQSVANCGRAYKLSSAMLRIIARCGSLVPANFADFFEHIRCVDPRPNPRVVLYVRISPTQRNAAARLKKSRRRCMKKLRELGFVVARVFSHVESATGADFDKRPCLRAAIEYARAHELPLVAHNPDRFIRPYFYTKKAQDEQPTQWECMQLGRLAKGVRLVTMLPPELSPSEVHSERTKEGMRDAERRLGRPSKRKTVHRLKSNPDLRLDAKRLREAGLSYRGIGKELGVPFSTIRSWLGC